MLPARRGLMVVAAGIFAIALCGCQRGSSPQAEALFGAERTTSMAAQADWMYPAVAAAASFCVIGEAGEATGEIEIEIDAEEGAHQWRVLYRSAGDETPFREDVLGRIDGRIVMLETLNRDRGALTLYDPPLLLTPLTLAPGAPIESESRMTAHPPDDRSRVTRRGDAIQRFEWMGTQQVKVGGRWIECARVRTEFRAQLAPAMVENVTERWYSEESPVGLVAERYDEKLFILGALSSTRGHVWVLKEIK